VVNHPLTQPNQRFFMTAENGIGQLPQLNREPLQTLAWRTITHQISYRQGYGRASPHYGPAYPLTEVFDAKPIS
jgi:hypothetical protein